MKLRYKLFLVVGSLFLVCYVIAVSVQAYVTQRSIKKAEQGMVQQIESIYRDKRLRIEGVLFSTLAERISAIETLLMSIDSYPPQLEDLTNPEKSWENLAGVFYSNKWLDFVQQSNEDSSNFTLLIDKRKLSSAKILGRAENSSNILKIESKDQEWIGIVLPFEALGPELVQGQKEPLKLLLLFSNEQIETLRTKPLNLEEVKEWTPLVEELQKLVLEASVVRSWKEVAVAASAAPSSKQEVKIFDEYLAKWVERSDQVIMIRILAEMAALKLFGETPDAVNFPQGIAVFSDNEAQGHSLLTSQALLQQIQLEAVVSSVFSKEFLFPPYIFIVCNEELYLGSTLKVDSGNKKGTLSIGICLRDIAQDLSDELDMPFFCVLNGKVFLQGTKWDELLKHFPIEKIGGENYGTLDVDGNSVFFMKIQPIPGIDLQFLGVNYAKREFAFLDSFEEGTKQVLDEIAKKMWLVAFAAVLLALLFLNRLAKRTTEPVTKLAAAAEAVGKGRLAEVTLPKMRIHRNDEIHSLYASFDEMVRSLKDKEKVRAALNKVVSPVIASEILKSDMQLGGEKKQVCVLFADIRGFTKMTESMTPDHVIVMLNHCMTRVSHVIDENKGIIDKYVGDEVMALFGIPNPQEDDALRAVHAAVGIQKLLDTWNPEREAEGKNPILMGIGIDIGEVLAGNMGATDRQNYTVLGRHVNIAARLCSKADARQILITEAVASSPHVRGQYEIREVGKESLKGITETITVYEVIIK